MKSSPNQQAGKFRSGSRSAALIGTATLTLAAVLLALIIGASLLEKSFIAAGAGDFLVRSYGLLAFAIPLYLLLAALILADPVYRPGRIFILSSAVFPFLTLALGFAFVRDFGRRAGDFAFLRIAGRGGFSFIIIILTVLEGLLIINLSSLLFKGKRKTAQPFSGAGGPRALLPSPRSKLKDLYTEAASGMETPLLHGKIPPGGAAVKQEARSPGRIIPELPELRPLSSRDAFRQLEPETPFPGEGSGDYAAGQETGGEGGFDEPGGFDESCENSEAIDADLEQALLDAETEAARHTAALLENRDEAGGMQANGMKIDDMEAADKANGPKPEFRLSKKRGPYSVPVEILNQYPDGQYWIIDYDTREAGVILKETLKEFNIQAEVTGIRKGPVITMFEILPAPGVKLSRIVNLQDNIALRLAASSVRIVAPIPGKHAVGIEVPNAKRNIVSFREIIEGEINRALAGEGKKEGRKSEVPVVLGKDITGEAQTVDLVQMPHLLIAGATGAGKSVCVNAMILSILYQRSPAECRLILIDPKIVELKLYNDIPHLLTPVITEPKRAFQALQYCIYEMERRYACLDSMGVRDIRSYNKRIKERRIAAEYMPYIVVVIDEFADLMATTGKELESTVARLAAMSRAVGIHLVLATQRPSIDVITGLIKANIPSRIAFMVASKMDSRIIIDMVGAEKLLGKGDMLYAGAVDPFPVRMQGAFVSEEEVERVVEYVKTLGEPDYIDDEIFYDEDEENASPSLFSEGEDPLYEKALEVVMQQGKASASYIQRRLKIGYNRAARLVEEMEHHGVVGPAQGSKPRELLRSV
ncbi:MAG: DNA translocase FtsK [Treponema sp.]|jgi:S-DNA-T family DNA segregation ATPase FtsK/SpoIIIE|nr:DNA translocase FtsK [Treponema sp.]